MKKIALTALLFSFYVANGSAAAGGSASASGSHPIDKLQSPVKVRDLEKLSGYYNPHTHEWVSIPLPETPERFAALASKLAKSRLRYARTELQASSSIKAINSVLAAIPAIPGGSPAKKSSFKKQIDDVLLDGLNAAAAVAQTVENYQLKPRRRATAASAAAMSDLLRKETDENEPDQNSAAVNDLVRQARAKINHDPEAFFQSPKASLAQAFAKTPPPFRLTSPANAAQLKANSERAIPAVAAPQLKENSEERAPLAPLRLNLDNIPAVVAAAAAIPPAVLDNQPAHAPAQDAPAPFWGLQQAQSGKIRKERQSKRVTPMTDKAIQAQRTRTNNKWKKAGQGSAKLA